jgi:tRNA pseudouridine55 synthase
MQTNPSGILPVDKPQGITSHDVVDKVRRLVGIRRVGHTGTLDPMATGLMLVCIGRATRLSEFLTGQNKTYQARVRFGEETDTYDAEGRVVASGGVPPEGLDPICRALEAFTGEIEQVPPMFSAARVGGRRLHEMARAGVEVARKPRVVCIHKAEPIAYESPDLDIVVSCSKGTYIRTLAHDLGGHLGCGAHLVALRRTEVGGIGIDQSSTLDDLAALTHEGRLGEALLEPARAFPEMPAVRLDTEQTRAFLHGNPTVAEGGFDVGTTLRVETEGGSFLGIGRWQLHTKGLRPVRVIADPQMADAR